MYTPLSARRSRHRHESSLLGRTITALKGSYVSITLFNNGIISGHIESYKRELHTANVYESLLDLHNLELSGSTLHVPQDIRNVYKSFRNTLSTQRERRHFVQPPTSQIVLTDAIVCSTGRCFRADRVELNERWVSTISPSTPSHNGEKPHRILPSSAQLRRLILQQPCDRIKNAAFLRCSRIGQNNLK